MNVSIDNRSSCFEIMTAVEEMELGALLELFPKRRGWEAWTFWWSVLGGRADSSRLKDSSQELRYGTDQQLQHSEIFAKNDA